MATGSVQLVAACHRPQKHRAYAPKMLQQPFPHAVNWNKVRLKRTHSGFIVLPKGLYRYFLFLQERTEVVPLTAKHTGSFQIQLWQVKSLGVVTPIPTTRKSWTNWKIWNFSQTCLRRKVDTTMPKSAEPGLSKKRWRDLLTWSRDQRTQKLLRGQEGRCCPAAEGWGQTCAMVRNFWGLHACGIYHQ